MKTSTAVHRRRDERGQGSLESLAVVIVAAVLVIASVGTIIQASPSVKDSVTYGICKITSLVAGGDCTPPGELRTAEDRIPTDPCVVNSNTNGGGVEVDVVVTVKKGWVFITEKMSDGTYRVTRINEDDIGVGVGPGFDVSVTWDNKKYGIVGNASADIFLSSNKGDTWIVDSKGDADDLRNKLLAGEVIDETAGSAPGVGGLISWGSKKLTGTDVRDPDESFHEGGVEGSAELAVSNVLFQGQGNVDMAAYAGYKTNKTGTVVYVKGKISGSYSMGAVWGPSEDPKASAEGLWEIQYDKKGEPVSMTLTTGVFADGSTYEEGDTRTLTERVFTMPIDDAASRDLYERALWDPTAVGDIANRAKSHGFMSEQTYDLDESSYGAQVTGKLVGKYGGGVSYVDDAKELTGSQYWDGEQMVDNPGCVAG